MISTYDLQSVPHRFFKEPIIVPKKIKLAEITILKIVKSPYLDEKSSYFDEIWYTTANLELDDSQMTKYEHFFLNSRWRTGAILKNRFFLAVTQQPIARFQ